MVKQNTGLVATSCRRRPKRVCLRDTFDLDFGIVPHGRRAAEKHERFAEEAYNIIANRRAERGQQKRDRWTRSTSMPTITTSWADADLMLQSLYPVRKAGFSIDNVGDAVKKFHPFGGPSKTSADAFRRWPQFRQNVAAFAAGGDTANEPFSSLAGA